MNTHVLYVIGFAIGIFVIAAVMAVREQKISPTIAYCYVYNDKTGLWDRLRQSEK